MARGTEQRAAEKQKENPSDRAQQTAMGDDGGEIIGEHVLRLRQELTHERLNFGHGSAGLKKGVAEQRDHHEYERDEIQEQVEGESHGEEEAIIPIEIATGRFADKPH